MPLSLEQRAQIARAEVDADWQGSRPEQVRQHMHRRVRRRRQVRRAASVVATLLAVFSGTHLLMRQKPQTDLSQDPKQISFADGSRVEKQTSDTQLETLEVSAHRVRVALHQGKARFRIQRNPRRSFVVQANDITVEVLGTVFDVERDSALQHVRVAVSEGLVQVTSNSEKVVLRPGETRTFGSLATVVEQAVPQDEDLVTNERKSKKDKKWSIRRPDKPSNNEVINRLLQSADEALLQDRPKEAISALRQIVKQFPKDPSAAFAAFDLAKIFLDRLDNPREAARIFGTVQTLAPHAELAENALAREIEAWHACGDREKARARLQEFVRLYPQSKRGDALQKLLSR